MKYLMCNLKSNKNLREILEYKEELKKINLNTTELIIFPSSIYLPFFYKEKYKLGSQNISIYSDGIHTGEILAEQLRSLNVSYTIINHCETNETEESIVKKIRNATKSNIKVVFCIGKKVSEDLELQKKQLLLQIDTIFNNLSDSEKNNIIIAYEPCYMINKDNILSLNYIEEIVKTIKQHIKLKYYLEIKVVYGGGINDNNINELLNSDIIDGYLLGKFANLAENICKVVEKI